MLTGNEIKAGKKIIDLNEVITVTSNKASVSKLPKPRVVGGKGIISVYKVEADGTNGEEYTYGTPSEGKPTEYSVSGKELTFYTSVTDGTKFRVYYTVETDATAKSVKVTSDAFGGTFKVVLDILVRDEFTKKDYQGQLIAFNAKFEDNFNLSLEASGEPSTVTLPLEILKDPVNTDMWELIIYDDSLIVKE